MLDLLRSPSSSVFMRTPSYQHVCRIEVVLAGHALFQFLGHLLDVLDLIQQIQDMLVLNPLDPQLAQFIPLAVQQHLARQQILFHLQDNMVKSSSMSFMSLLLEPAPHSPNPAY